MRHHVGVSAAPVPSPRPGGDDADAAQLPQQRAVGTPRPGGPPAAEADLPAAVMGDPRPAPDDAPAPVSGVDAVPAARVYADGSALAQYVDGAACHEEWLAWATGNEAGLLTTPLGLTELRRFALPGGVEARGVAHEVEQRIEVVRFSDQTLRAATKVSGVLPSFVALHIGAALVHPGVRAVATYETQLARVAALHGLMVVSPGRPPFWWEHGD
jgi:hypothetical protein